MRLTFKSIFSINPVSLTVGAVLLVIILFAARVTILDLIELKTYDLRFLFRGQEKPSSAVVIAAIDEKSLDKVGRWPWPRSKIADLIGTLSSDGAKVIGFDVGFLEPDENSQLSLINQLSLELEAQHGKNSRLAILIEESRKQADNDLALSEAIKNSSADVVLGYFFYMSQSDLDYTIDQGEIDEQVELINGSKYPFVLYEELGVEHVPSMKAYAPKSNLKMLTDVAASSGYFTLQNDRDGVLRWMPLTIEYGEELYPPLAILCSWHYLGEPQMMVKVSRYGIEGIEMGDRFIPTDESGQLLVNYMGPAKTFPHFSIADILSGNFPAGTFKDKIVLVGATATGIYDLRNTPFSPSFPGVEIHANVIDNILTGNIISKPRWSRIFDLFAIVILGSLVGTAIPRMSALKGFLFVAGLAILYISAALWLFVKNGVWLDMVYPLLTLLLSYIVLIVYYYATEERERKKIKSAFTHYVAPVVIEAMLKDPSRLKLGGEEKILTVLFSDLQGFTSASERYSPNEMIVILSDYYASMTEEVFAYQGMLKEYVGDEMMAIFGAPIDQADHAERACAAALAMRDQRNLLNEEWAKIGRPPLIARTGVNSGRMLVGNLGSKYRLAYGVLGDQVNLGSRLEGLNKEYGTEILIGENTAELVGNSFVTREIDMVQVVGREQPVRIYELLAGKNVSIPREQEEAFRFYAAGLEAYRQQRWGEALDCFGKSLDLWPNDYPSRTMAERCSIYQETPPPEEWDGVFEAVHKYK